jgi:hypothetical protein
LSIWLLLVVAVVVENCLQMLVEAGAVLGDYLQGMRVLLLVLLTRLPWVLEVQAAQEVIHLLAMEHQAQIQFLVLYPLQVVVLVLLETELLALAVLEAVQVLALVLALVKVFQVKEMLGAFGFRQPTAQAVVVVVRGQ